MAQVPSGDQKEPPVNEMIKPLTWLLGKWRCGSGGLGRYPTMSDFEYGEEAEFFTVGQPNVQFSFYSWDASSKKPLHREVGFIRIKPGTQEIALMSAQNTGITDIEEGEVKDNELTVETTAIHRMGFSKDPATRKVVRTLTRTGDKLKHVLSMETANTPMTEHLCITYDKVQ